MHLGKESFWSWDDTTPSIGEGDLMICACGSANVGHENYVAEMAKKNGAKLALITPSSEGFLLSIADMVVNVPAAAYKAVGDFVPSEQLMGNLFEQTLFIFYDILVMMLREEMDIKSRRNGSTPQKCGINKNPMGTRQGRSFYNILSIYKEETT